MWLQVNDVPKWYGGQPPMLLLSKRDTGDERPLPYQPGQQPTLGGMVEWLKSEGVAVAAGGAEEGGEGEGNAPKGEL